MEFLYNLLLVVLKKQYHLNYLLFIFLKQETILFHSHKYQNFQKLKLMLFEGSWKNLNTYKDLPRFPLKKLEFFLKEFFINHFLYYCVFYFLTEFLIIFNQPKSKIIVDKPLNYQLFSVSIQKEGLSYHQNLKNHL